MRLIYILFGYLGLILMLIASFYPQAHTTASVEHLDKLLHFATYLIATYYHLWLYPNRNKYLLCFSMLVFGGLIEILQPILSNRTAEWIDLLANLIGIIGAFYLYQFKILSFLQKN
jgi:VanZ family protein